MYCTADIEQFNNIVCKQTSRTFFWKKAMHVAHVMRWPKTSSGSLLELSFGFGGNWTLNGVFW